MVIAIMVTARAEGSALAGNLSIAEKVGTVLSAMGRSGSGARQETRE
jgi:hypothetical protein